MAQRLIIAALLFLVGVAFYLSASGAPLRVHAVEVPFQLAFLGAGSLIAWRLGSSRGRWVALATLVAAGSVVRVYALSQVIHSLYPIHPLFFLTGALGLAVELALFLGLTWALDWAISAVRRSFA